MGVESRPSRPNPPPQIPVNIKQQPHDQETSHLFCPEEQIPLSRVSRMPERGLWKPRGQVRVMVSSFICSRLLICEAGEEKNCAVKPQTYMQKKYFTVVSTRPHLCQEASLEAIWTGSADAQDSLFQSQKRYDSSFLSDLPGLQGEEANNYPLGRKKKKRERCQLLGKFICQGPCQGCQGKLSG